MGEVQNLEFVFRICGAVRRGQAHMVDILSQNGANTEKVQVAVGMVGGRGWRPEEKCNLAVKEREPAPFTTAIFSL